MKKVGRFFAKGNTLNLGVKQTAETIEKRRQKLKLVPHTAEWNKKISVTLKERGIRPASSLGRKCTLEAREKMREAAKKRWGDSYGNGKRFKDIRYSQEYKVWRKSVYERDNYTCIWCKKQGGRLNADHIKPFALYPELRFAIDNGRTLCIDCHKTTDSFGWKFYHNKNKL